MERTITFIAEHKKREYEQLKEETELENIPLEEQQDLDFDLESDLADWTATFPIPNDIWKPSFSGRDQ